MPEVFRIGGFRFSFVSREGTEPPHSVEQAERYAKFWIDPVSLVESRGFRSAELRTLHSLIAKHLRELNLAWDEHFGP